MNKLLATSALLFSAALATAAPTKIEIGRPASDSDDKKPNSSAVPDAYAIPAEIDHTFVFRLKYKTDLLDGIEALVKQRGIRNGVILAGIGSVTGYHYHMVSNTTFPTKNIFIKDPDAPADIASMNGYILDGKVHAHITFADAEKAFGGHLESGTTVFTFAVVTIGVFRDDIDLRRVDDKNHR
ncbi:MAG: DNA-binding protein [Nibricoccus sp.]